jgi:hypothetical protein
VIAKRNAEITLAARRTDSTAKRLWSAVMANLAYSTGGTFFHNNNDLDEGLPADRRHTGIYLLSRILAAETGR